MKKYIVFFSTMFIFAIEAILHYNIGKNDLTNIEIPDLVDTIKILAVVGFFSLLNTFLINLLES
jgi:hypothetical protein